MKRITKSTLKGNSPGRCWIAVLLLTITSVPAGVAGQGLSRISLLTSIVVSQTSENDAVRKFTEANQLLREARQQMQSGDFDEAKSLIDRAESLGVPASSYYAATTDTPEKLRGELGQLRSEKINTPPRTRRKWLSYLFGRGKTENLEVPLDPFNVEENSRSVFPIDQTKARAVDFLDRGRLSLSQGNVSGAVAWYQKAVALNVKFRPDEYSPGQLLKELQSAGVDNVDAPSSQLGVPSTIGQPVSPLVTTVPGTGASTVPRNESTRPNSVPAYVVNPLANTFTKTNAKTQTSTAPDPGLLDFATGHDRRPTQIVQKNRDLSVTHGTGKRSGDVKNRTDVEGISETLEGVVNNSDKQLLREARLALATGDVDRAGRLARQAATVGVVNPIQDDTPHKVISLIRRFGQLPPMGSSSTTAGNNNSERAKLLMEQSEGLLRYGDYTAARELALKAKLLRDDGTPMETSNLSSVRPNSDPLGLNASTELSNGTSQQTLDTAPLPKNVDSRNGSSSFNSSFLFTDVDAEKTRVPSNTASTISEVAGDADSNSVAQAIYKPNVDNTENRFANAIDSDSQTPQTPSGRVGPSIDQLIRKGDQALVNNDFAKARAYFLRAMQNDDELSLSQRQQLQDRMQKIGSGVKPNQVTERGNESNIEKVHDQQAVLYRQFFAEITYIKRQVDQQRTQDPIAALEKLKELQKRISASELTQSSQRELSRRVSRSTKDLVKYIEDNRADIELDQQNQKVLTNINRERQLEVEMQTKLSELVEEFETLLEQQRFAEAELLARQARQIDPENPLTEVMVWKSTFIKRYMRNMNLRELSEQGVDAALADVEKAAVPYNTAIPFQLPDSHEWKDLKRRRERYSEQKHTHLTEAELEIQQQLSTPVEVRFNNRPLSEVMNTLANLTGVNLYLDPEGLAAEGVTSNESVDLNLTGKPISLRSALTLILQPLHLSYVIQNEVLKITSEQMRDSEVYAYVYNVADLVAPIPNFNPSHSTGLPDAIAAAHEAVGYGGGNIGGQGYRSPLGLSQQQQQVPPPNSPVLAQMMNNGLPLPGRSIGGGSRQLVNAGPSGLGGAAQADFEPLIELIRTTIAPTSWDEVGGPGAIHEFEGTLSLVISQTQDVHDQIADLLLQLRKLQDLQVTIEVRFITLSDNFFERIGLDFDFEIDDNTGLDLAGLVTRNEDASSSITVGLDPSGNPTADLDLSFTQDGFGAAVPAFGGFDAATAANFGFAILSDIEAFFLIQAAQGDSRTNVLQAPKVTLFNGQQASIQDQAQQPFVTGIIPVVGDFAAAQQPVITVLSEGTTLSVQAVVSPDRRFVRLTLVPFFSQIGDVQTFTFQGRTSSNTGTSAADPTDDTQSIQNGAETVTEGTTVQLPEFIFTTVTTTVSVPDGGTVLLGGIKRVREGRTERGVPMLDKLPYINRLFKNVGIGREAESLMLMVTPRIIIQDEEEQLLLGGTGP